MLTAWVTEEHLHAPCLACPPHQKRYHFPTPSIPILIHPKPKHPNGILPCSGLRNVVSNSSSEECLGPTEVTYAWQTCSTGSPLTLAITCATCLIVAGSLRPLTIKPRCHFSFFTAFGKGGASAEYVAEAWEARISHWVPLASLSPFAKCPNHRTKHPNVPICLRGTGKKTENRKDTYPRSIRLNHQPL